LLDLPKSHDDSLPIACEGCILGKQHRHSFPKDGATRATKVLEIVHSNVCGSMKDMSLGRARYFLTSIDDFSRKMWVYPLKAKSECFERFKEFKALAEKEVESHIKVLRSDNGGEYTSNQFEAYLKAQGKIIRCCDVTFCEHGELQEELELRPSGSNYDKEVLILDIPPTSIDGEEVDSEDDSDSDSEDQPLVDGDGGSNEC
jgi:hypothetical protein